MRTRQAPLGRGASPLAGLPSRVRPAVFWSSSVTGAVYRAPDPHQTIQERVSSPTNLVGRRPGWTMTRTYVVAFLFCCFIAAFGALSVGAAGSAWFGEPVA